MRVYPPFFFDIFIFSHILTYVRQPHISLYLTSVFILSHVFIRAIPLCIGSKITEYLLARERVRNRERRNVWLTYVRCTAKC